MSPRTQRSPALETPGGTAALQAAETDTQRTTTLARYPVTSAVGYPPSGRRTKYLTLVPECSLCGLAHVHRGTEGAPAKGAYRAGCGGVYWLATVIVPRQYRAEAIA